MKFGYNRMILLNLLFDLSCICQFACRIPVILPWKTLKTSWLHKSHSTFCGGPFWQWWATIPLKWSVTILGMVGDHLEDGW